MNSYRQDNLMVQDYGPIKVEKLIFNFGKDYYEVFAAEGNSQQILFSYIFSVKEEEKRPVVKRETLTKNGISTTEKPDDVFIDLILEKTSEQ